MHGSTLVQMVVADLATNFTPYVVYITCMSDIVYIVSVMLGMSAELKKCCSCVIGLNYNLLYNLCQLASGAEGLCGRSDRH